MTELIIADLVKKTGRLILAIVGILIFILGFLVWLTNGTILNYPYKKVATHDTIYLPKPTNPLTK